MLHQHLQKEKPEATGNNLGSTRVVTEQPACKVSRDDRESTRKAPFIAIEPVLKARLQRGDLNQRASSKPVLPCKGRDNTLLLSQLEVSDQTFSKQPRRAWQLLHLQVSVMGLG